MSTACAARVGHRTCCIYTAFGPTCKAHHNPWCIMSFQAMAKAVEIKLPTHEKFVLIMLANYADESGKCWPSVETLCSDTGMSRAAVHKALAKLVKRGLVERAKRFKKNIQTTSIYVIRWS